MPRHKRRPCLRTLPGRIQGWRQILWAWCLRPGINFINILHVTFLYKSALQSFSLITFWLCNFFGKRILSKKPLVKCRWNWLQDPCYPGVTCYSAPEQPYYRCGPCPVGYRGDGKTCLPSACQQRPPPCFMVNTACYLWSTILTIRGLKIREFWGKLTLPKLGL